MSSPTEEKQTIKRLLLIDNMLDDIEFLKRNASEGTVVFVYDANATSFQVLEDLLKHPRVARGTFRDIGWLFHGSDSMRLFKDMDGISAEQKNPSFLSVMSMCGFLGTLKHLFVPDCIPVPRIDLLACSLANAPGFIRVAKLVRDTVGLDLAASTNLTGSISGTDWILETHGIDTEARYFQKKGSLAKYEHTFC